MAQPGARVSARDSFQKKDTFSSSDALSSRGQSNASLVGYRSDDAAPSVAVLRSDVSLGILRGVSAATVLRGFGAAFRKHAFQQEDYLQSVPVDHLDDFLSHDWSSGWQGKAIALCLVYNAWPAALASLLFGLALGVLQCKPWRALPLPKPDSVRTDFAGECGYWCMLACPLVYALLFVCWQDLRAALRLGRTLTFLDKFCIDQLDVERKVAGILGLGGFLRHTDRLIIFWTPRYFTRLWCTYEVASWLHLGKPLHAIEFLPLSHAKCVAIVAASVCGMFWLYCAAMVFVAGQLFIVVVLAALALALPIALHFVRELVQDFRRLPEQLEEFSITNAGCFCCASDHKTPGKPEVTLPCDRKLVFDTVAAWFNESGRHDRRTSMRQQMGQFDHRVREILGPWIMERAGPTQLPYGYIVLCGWPYLFRCCDALAAAGAFPAHLFFRYVLGLYPLMAFTAVPVTYRSGLLVSAWLDARFGTPKSRCGSCQLTLALFLAVLLVFMATWAPANVCVELRSPIPFLASIAVNVVVAAVVFRQDFRRSRLSAARTCARWLGRTCDEADEHRLPTPVDLEGATPPPSPKRGSSKKALACNGLTVLCLDGALQTHL